MKERLRFAKERGKKKDSGSNFNEDFGKQRKPSSQRAFVALEFDSTFILFGVISWPLYVMCFVLICLSWHLINTNFSLQSSMKPSAMLSVRLLTRQWSCLMLWSLHLCLLRVFFFFFHRCQKMEDSTQRVAVPRDYWRRRKV